MKRLLLTLAATCLLAATAQAQDVCAPAKVTSFSQTATWYGAFTITWTATGDDCTTGNASTYEVYYSTSAITDANWQKSPAVLAASGSSATNGNTDSVCLTVAPCSTGTRYFAIFLIDEAGNRSPIATGTGNARCSAPYEICE